VIAGAYARGVSDYARSTTAATLERLPAPLRDAIAERAAGAGLDLPGDAPAWLTHSVRLRRPGLLGRMTGTADRDPEHETALVVGPRDVVVATHGPVRGTAVLHARLEDVEAASLGGAFGALATAVDDDGMTITGFPTTVDGSAARGSFFVGLGAPDGDAARTALEAAVRAAKAR
jgi:hypothetical protein